ncbi:hypothetical protein TRICI_006490 [Trichomonascus ciferrii]|uniref:RRM domain-containing protein n=1 Tax=Trichomonascus ciferrii TaxID=44093 RepID=A0A642UGR2_9ASCO|nr:hypothetical protein TRICI_006490 [Trichomonascus ciferrii]
MAQYEMQFTPLLPSQLLMGSPFQPGTPAIAQFGSFSGAQEGPQGYPYPHHQYSSAPLDLDARSRTVYLGNVPNDTTPEELLNHVRSGVVESVKMVPEKNCAFISFLDHSSAAHFHSDAILKKLSIKSHDIKIGWGKSNPISPTVQMAVSQDGASRNVYLGNLPEDISAEQIHAELSKFGPIDTIKLIRDKNIGFVHFLNIATAVRVVQQLPYEPAWAQRKIYYGKDRCAYISKTQQQNAAQYLGISPGYEHILANADREMLSTALAQQSAAAVAVATTAGGANNVGNRTVYLGNVHPETTIEEICNVVRGGLLHAIRYIPEKHICFVTFVDPTAAAQFFAMANLQGLAIHNRRLKVGWGKHSGPLPNAIALAVTAGASRNVYIGNIDDNWPEAKLRHDFAEFGEIEQINFLAEKSCAFVNFTNITNAIKAIEGIKQKDDYKQFKINFGKDRCGNPPRQLQHRILSPTGQHDKDGENNSNSAYFDKNSSVAYGTTPGSHVLAQYLAQAQQEQYMYAAAVAAQSYTPESDPSHNGYSSSHAPAEGNNDDDDEAAEDDDENKESAATTDSASSPNTNSATTTSMEEKLDDLKKQNSEEKVVGLAIES